MSKQRVNKLNEEAKCQKDTSAPVSVQEGTNRQRPRVSDMGSSRETNRMRSGRPRTLGRSASGKGTRCT